jgi:hypothetical protein
MKLLLIVLAPALAASGAPQSAGFDDGALTSLSARVVGTDPVAKSVASAIVRVSVQNDGGAPAEPLVFRFQPAGRKDPPAPLTVRRVDAPHYGRAGRTIAPGKRLEYQVLVPLEEKLAKTAAVEVQAASFPRAAASLENPVRILASELVRAVDRDLGRTTKRTRIELANAAPYELDVVLRARFASPLKAESLIEVRLPANARHAVVIDELPTERGRGYSEAEIVDLEVVDWCAIVTRGEDLARALFTAAWDAWYRLPDDVPGLRGSFTYRFQEGARGVAAAGAFHLSRDGAVRVDPPADPAVAGALRDAFRDVCRPTAEKALDGLALELFELGGPERDGRARASILRLDRAPFLECTTEAFLGIVDGRIAWSSVSRAPLPRELWTTRAVDEAERAESASWVAAYVEHRAAFQATPVDTRRTRYERVGALLVPVDYRTTSALEAFPDSAKSMHLALSDVSIGTVLAPAPPTGDLADALRAAWDAPYRYPDPPRTLAGRYAIETPATDGVWHGQRKVQGAFRLVGFRGRTWDRAEVTVEGRGLTAEMQSMLADAVEDRFHLFAHRDFAGRSPFDGAFAGATLAGTPDRVEVEFAAFTSIEIQGGLPTVLERPGGSRRTLELTRLGKALVPTTIATDGETIRATWADLGDGWAYPKELVFERVFGPDWGPETIRLTKLAVE